MQTSARFLAALIFFASIIPGQALAANNAVVITPGTGVTMRSQDIGGGVQSMVEIPGDTSGNPLATAPGTGNTSFALPVQGVAGGVAMPVSAASLPLPTGAATSALQTTGNSTLSTINTTLGSPFQAGGSIGNTSFAVTQGTSSNLKGQFDPLTISTWGLQATGSAVPTNTQLTGGSDGTNIHSFKTDTSGDQIVIGAGTAGTANSGVVTVQGIASMTPVQVSQATASNLNATVVGTGTFAVQSAPSANGTWGLFGQSGATAPTNALLGGCTYNSGGQSLSSGNSGALQCDNANNLYVNVKSATGLVQGSTTSGQTGSLVMGASSTSPPSYTTADTNPLSTDLNGGIRTSPACTGVINITQTTTTDVHTFTHYGYICSIMLVSASAQNIGIDEGAGTTCESSGTALVGVSSTSSATPTVAIAANGGFSMVSGVPLMKLQASADHLCVLQSGSGNVSGTITYADLTN